MSLRTRIAQFIGENLNGILMFAGWLIAYHGIAQWSSAAADVTAGVSIIAVGAVPYMRRPRSK